MYTYNVQVHMTLYKCTCTLLGYTVLWSDIRVSGYHPYYHAHTHTHVVCDIVHCTEHNTAVYNSTKYDWVSWSILRACPPHGHGQREWMTDLLVLCWLVAVGNRLLSWSQHHVSDHPERKWSIKNVKVHTYRHMHGLEHIHTHVHTKSILIPNPTISPS
jgi:hypothetical protein